jgi:hypothetical protein
VMACSAAIPIVEVRIAGVLSGGAVAALSLRSNQRHVDELERERAGALEDDVCEVLIHNIGMLEHLKKIDGGLFRASVFLLDATDRVLRPAMCSHGFTDRDLEVVWGKGEGPPGLAWHLGRPVFAPPADDDALRASMAHQISLPGNRDGGLAATSAGPSGQPIATQQVEFLEQVEMVVCYPIFDIARTNRVLGVLMLDDRLPPGPHLAEVLRAAEFLRDEVRRRLSARVSYRRV